MICQGKGRDENKATVSKCVRKPMFLPCCSNLLGEPRVVRVGLLDAVFVRRRDLAKVQERDTKRRGEGAGE